MAKAVEIKEALICEAKDITGAASQRGAIERAAAWNGAMRLTPYCTLRLVRSEFQAQ
jgi:hypothetical protein